MKFKSRKFILTTVTMALASLLPIIYRLLAISDSVTMLVLGILSVVGAGYSVINLKEKSNE